MHAVHNFLKLALLSCTVLYLSVQPNASLGFLIGFVQLLLHSSIDKSY